MLVTQRRILRIFRIPNFFHFTERKTLSTLLIQLRSKCRKRNLQQRRKLIELNCTLSIESNVKKTKAYTNVCTHH